MYFVCVFPTEVSGEAESYRDGTRDESAWLGKPLSGTTIIRNAMKNQKETSKPRP
jgi:hypothetical protein